MFDRFIREKTNANMITYKLIIMNRTSKSSEWQKRLTPEKRSSMIKWEREFVSKQCQDFKQLKIKDGN